MATAGRRTHPILVPALFSLCFSLADVAAAACLVITARPAGSVLTVLALPPAAPQFILAYIHSVTRTPIRETYVVENLELSQTAIHFEQHGPGLPTGPATGETWQRDGTGWRVTMQRRFPEIAMRVDADQSPQIVTATVALDLAQWGNRSLLLRPGTGPICDPTQ